LASKGDIGGAIGAFREAIRIQPGLADAHYNLGMALKARGDRGGAIEAFRVYLGLEADEGMRGKARELIRQLGGTP
jgi:tetratricopeptide (TPR) repeat protein